MNPATVPQPRLIADFEAVLQQLIDEHRKLLKLIEAQQTAMKVMNLKGMDEATHRQEESRLQITTLDAKRRGILLQLGKTLRVVGEPKIGQLAEFIPHRKTMLLKLRKDLRDVLEQLSSRNHVVGRVTGAVLGHLNTAMRLFAGAVEHAGLYTRRGVPQMGPRIGMMETVG